MPESFQLQAMHARPACQEPSAQTLPALATPATPDSNQVELQLANLAMLESSQPMEERANSALREPFLALREQPNAHPAIAVSNQMISIPNASPVDPEHSLPVVLLVLFVLPEPFPSMMPPANVPCVVPAMNQVLSLDSPQTAPNVLLEHTLRMVRPASPVLRAHFQAVMAPQSVFLAAAVLNPTMTIQTARSVLLDSIRAADQLAKSVLQIPSPLRLVLANVRPATLDQR